MKHYPKKIYFKGEGSVIFALGLFSFQKLLNKEDFIMTLFQAVLIGIMVWFGGFIYIDRICKCVEEHAKHKWGIPELIEKGEAKPDDEEV